MDCVRSFVTFLKTKQKGSILFWAEFVIFINGRSKTLKVLRAELKQCHLFIGQN